MSWQDFEIECTDYLNEKYGNKGEIDFVHMGKADSTVSDIRVDIKGSPKFYVEVKMDASQCGQFVLLPDFENKKFVFSPRNDSTETTATKKIISYMDNRFDDFSDGGILEMYDSVYYEWVIEHYKNLGAKYIITAYYDNFIIFPIEKFADYFNIKATYRVKRSGSRAPTKTQQAKVIDLLKEHTSSFSYSIVGDDLIVQGEGLEEKDRFDIDNNTYYLAGHPNGYRVRILSKTANLNVIFSIFLKKYAQDPSDLTAFVSNLK